MALHSGRYILTRATPRPWGPLTSTNASTSTSSPSVGDGTLFAVVRDAFRDCECSRGDSPLPLSHIVEKTGDASVRVNPEYVADPAKAQVVDLYNSNGETVHRGKGSMELSEFLHSIGTHMSLWTDKGGAMDRSLVIPQSTNEVLMVAPTAFRFNDETAADNFFMHGGGRDHGETSMRQAVLREHAGETTSISTMPTSMLVLM